MLIDLKVSVQDHCVQLLCDVSDYTKLPAYAHEITKISCHMYCINHDNNIPNASNIQYIQNLYCANIINQ